ncbi:MAG: GGDEF domain-containing protein [Steroidobacterales bacterium]
MRSTRSIEILCLALATLVLVWSRAFVHHPWATLALPIAFLAAIVAFRSQRLFRSRTRLRLSVESWSMMVFVTGVLLLTGRSASPMLNLYLLPVILSALTLGRLTTLLQVAVIGVIHLVLALVTPGVQVLSLAYAGTAVGELAPMLLVAYLTATLAADVTEAREHIETLAQTDPLTGLLNLRTFNGAWQRVHAASEPSQAPYAVLMVDIDHLKSVNESFGHAAGDSVLTLVARSLQRSIRNTDHAARYAGDEFTILLPGATPQVAEEVIARVRNNVYKTTLDLGSRMIRSSVAVGVANYPKDGREVRELLGAAESNMYRDKALRRPPAAGAKS